MTKIEVGVLGATGMVGQQFVSRLEHHPWFNVTWLAASERSEGKKYTEASAWRLSAPMPEAVRNLTVNACQPGRGLITKCGGTKGWQVSVVRRLEQERPREARP